MSFYAKGYTANDGVNKSITPLNLPGLNVIIYIKKNGDRELVFESIKPGKESRTSFLNPTIKEAKKIRPQYISDKIPFYVTMFNEMVEGKLL